MYNGGIFMDDNNIKIFVHRNLFHSNYRNLFSSWLMLNVPKNHSIFDTDGLDDIKIPPPTPAMESSLADKYTVAQKVLDGYIYASLETIKELLRY